MLIFLFIYSTTSLSGQRSFKLLPASSQLHVHHPRLRYRFLWLMLVTHFFLAWAIPRITPSMPVLALNHSYSWQCNIFFRYFSTMKITKLIVSIRLSSMTDNTFLSKGILFFSLFGFIYCQHQATLKHQNRSWLDYITDVWVHQCPKNDTTECPLQQPGVSYVSQSDWRPRIIGPLLISALQTGGSNLPIAFLDLQWYNRLDLRWSSPSIGGATLAS